MTRREMEENIEKLSEELLHQWCEAILQIQVKGTGNKRLDGGILCPACGLSHGRCIDLVYPFMRMAREAADRKDEEESRKWIEAVKAIFSWADQNVQQKRGVYWNDIGSAWTGTTVFFASSLAKALWFHGDLLTEEERSSWKKRLFHAAEYLYKFDGLLQNNVNYPLSNVLALYECGEMLGEKKYQEKAAEWVKIAFERMSPSGLLIGEGIPWNQKSARGCSPVDIGYNMEETIPNLLLYGKLSGNERVQKLAERYLLSHLDFMLEDGALDNSFGTRNFKWSYWGSRTSDGAAFGCLLLAEKHPKCMEAAYRNLKLLKGCTSDGILYGGPHYKEAGQPPCSHHTFSHAKVLAEILDRKELWKQEVAGEAETEEILELPSQRGLREYPELLVSRIFTPSVTATVTAYDREYKDVTGGHVSGGTLSMVHHKILGTLLCAGMGEYTRIEPANMQTPWQIRHECLAPQIEAVWNGELYSSIYETAAQVKTQEMKTDVYLVNVTGQLKNQEHQLCKEHSYAYHFSYWISENGIRIEAECPGGKWICPVISSKSERVTVNPHQVVLEKERGTVLISSDQTISLPYGTERIFNLIPGFCALRMETELQEQMVVWNIRWGIENE